MIVDIIRRNISAVRVGKVTRLDFLKKKSGRNDFIITLDTGKCSVS